MLFFSKLNIEKAFNAIRRVVSVFVMLALAVPTLRAEDEGRNSKPELAPADHEESCHA